MADSVQKRAQDIALLEAIKDNYASYPGIQVINPQWKWARNAGLGTDVAKAVLNTPIGIASGLNSITSSFEDARNIENSRIFQAKQRAAKDLGKPISDVTNAELLPYLAATGVPDKFEGRLLQQGLFDSPEDVEFIKKLHAFLKASDNTHVYNPFKFAENQSFFDSEGFKGLSFEDQVAFLHELVDDTEGNYAVKTGEDLDDYHQRIGRVAAEFGIRKAKEQNEKLKRALDEEKVRKIVKQAKPSSFANAKISEDDIPIKTPVYDRPEYTIHDVNPQLDALDEMQYYRSKEYRNKVLDSLNKPSNAKTKANTDIRHIKFFI